VALAHVAAGTNNIKIGAGGIMLPNHAPLVIAEQFGTLEALFPRRIDLGLGRAPGSDAVTQRVLRSDPQSAERFPEDILELQAWFREPQAGQRVRAVPGAGLRVPIWILGSSLFGAQLAASLGLPYAFASHFAPAALMQAIALYRERFQPSPYLDRPYLMLGVAVVAADETAAAKRLHTSSLQSFLALRRGMPGELPPPDETFSARLEDWERALLADITGLAIVGNLADVRKGLQDFVARTGADELMITSHIYDHSARVRSIELSAEAVQGG
jgi:luciferase family oxidoreductase group 1